MNKVFKVIWSEARNAYVVVSEIAKNHGSKSCSTKKLLTMLIATGVMTCASVAPVMAANPAPNDTQIAVGKDAKANGGDSVAIGNGAEAKAANGIAIGDKSLSGDRGWGVAIGGNTQAIGTYSVALGQTAKALEYEGIAIGHTSLSEGSGAIAIGKSTNAKGAASLAFGNDAKALNEASIAFGQGSNSSGNGSIAVGRSSKAIGANSIAIGNQAITSKDNSVVIGGHTYKGTTGTSVTGVGQQTQVLGDYSAAFGMTAKANADRATAIGSYANAMVAGSVALGAGSTVSREAGAQGYDPLTRDKSANTSFAWKSTKGAVSVGGVGVTRQIINVAAGSEDADAVNVAQLKAATENAGWNLSTGKEITNPTKVKSGDIVDFSGDGENITVSKEETDYATLVNVKLNKNLNVDSVQAGDFFMNNEKGIGFGGNAYITKDGLNANDKVITNVAKGKYNTDAVNVGQLKEVEEVAANANKGWNLSTNGVVTEATNVAPGEYVDFSGDKNISVSHDGTKVKVELNKDIDVNSVQTNALNSKYNLSVGTMAENGIMPFFVNSTGDFYAAHNKFHVDKDGKVTATAGEIGNVVLQNGVYTGHSALRNGELFVGDASGNYSQITPKSAKLGKVTIDKDGKISGVAAGINDNDAVNVSQLKNSAWKLAANGVLTEAEDVKAGDYVDFSGDQNVSVSKDVKDGVKTVKVELNKDLIGIESISNDGAKLTLNGTATELTNGKGAAITLFGDTTTINNKVTVYKDGRISGVAAGIRDTDAVNVSQLKAVGTTANMGWNLATNGVATEATNVKPGDFVDFSGDKNISVSHDGTKVKVELNKDIDVNSVQTNALNSKYNLSVGTMAENGIMPFFVNSTGDFYAAHNKFHVDKDGKVTATAGEIGNVVLQNGVYTGHSALRDGELFVGDASGNYSQITTKGAKLGKVTVAEDGKISGVAAGAVTADSTDAVNGSQLHAVATEAGKHSKVVSGNNINVEETDVDGQKFYKVNMNKDIMLGDLTGKNVSISGTNGTIEATGAIATKDRVYADKGAKLADIDVTGNKISNGASSIVLDGSNVKVNDKVTIDQDGKISGVAAGEVSKTSTDAINGSQLNQTNENVAALDKRVTQNEADIAQNKADIAQNKADIAQNKTDIKNLDNRVTNVEELAKKHTTVTAGDNIAVTESTNKDGGKEYKVALDKDINLDSVTTGQIVMNNDGLKVGKDVSVTATAVTAGKTSISDEGVKVGDKTYISDKGLNANDQKVTNVAAGELSATSKDAVNGSQLYETNQAIANNATNISSLSHSISNLDNRVNKVGAGAAALAALHPLDFDPDAKWDFAAGYGNYRGANAAAVGAYYRPNEDTMFSVGGTFGNGENMVNAGVSFKLGSGSNHVSTSRVAMAKEIKELRGELEAMKSAMLDANAGKKIDTSKLQLFPDVSQNHWAYEYVAQLAGNGMIEGYPDGNFAGDRPMTRYEFAAILYRAMTKGAVLSDKILSEFSHELEYFTVDTIAKDKAGNPTIQRVRTVKENKNK